jgi:hypothetical protein
MQLIATEEALLPLICTDLETPSSDGNCLEQSA